MTRSVYLQQMTQPNYETLEDSFFTNLLSTVAISQTFDLVLIRDLTL